MKDIFAIENYGKKGTFSGFLPGIAGEKGIPIWCFYVNRGQGVVSFGVRDKDHSIMEFYPAHQAYQNVKRTGFRTFIKRDGYYTEPFANENKTHRMVIGKGDLTIEEEDGVNHLHTKVEYFTLPGEPIGALVRKVSITNTDLKETEIEILDGMPALIPYGISLDSMKQMGQTNKAWMQVENVETGIPYFRVRVSMEDSAEVSEILGGNFAAAVDDSGKRLSVIVDPEVVFGYDNSLQKAIGFLENSTQELLAKPQVLENQLPCCFFAAKKELKAGETYCIYELIGQVENQEILDNFVSEKLSTENKTSNELSREKAKIPTFFQQKQQISVDIVDNLCKTVDTKTGNGNFDSYCRYTFMDNLLRGGYPVMLPGDHVFYLYSRKHGDLERDYNYFTLLPEFYTQGNGNFRDVNQNRRCDVMFAPFVGDYNIKTFYSLLQLDGCNPLGVEQISYELPKDSEYRNMFPGTFTPGEIYAELGRRGIPEDQQDALFAAILKEAKDTIRGDFKEGYWSDHWTYNLDLVENYLSVFPEKAGELLFETSYPWYAPKAAVQKRSQRYCLTAKGLRQYYALKEGGLRQNHTADQTLDQTSNQTGASTGDFEADATGKQITSTLAEKMLILSTVKFTSLDPYGMGIEMEGGKPGWYDALNGLPGIFGSGMSETSELLRSILFLIGQLEGSEKSLSVLEEAAALFRDITKITKEELADLKTNKKVLFFWNRINDSKEEYRKKIYDGISGARTEMSLTEILDGLKLFAEVLTIAIAKAGEVNEDVFPTYFYYEVTDYEKTEDGYRILDLEQRQVPDFLEGTVHALKLPKDRAKKLEMYNNLRASRLFDEKLQMYKVNADLSSGSYELGRAKAFTPGWLENESVWLHMEYKYLLELLKSGLYDEFFRDFQTMAVPFLDPEIYGRSILENSSFIASSANPNPKIHGKGFVARLSGSTVEFLNMWQIMMFGKKPFYEKDGKLHLQFTPAIPAYLLDEAPNPTVTTTFLGNTKVIYTFDQKTDYLPGISGDQGEVLFPANYSITSIQVKYPTGERYTTTDPVIDGTLAKDIRDGGVSEIRIAIKSM